MVAPGVSGAEPNASERSTLALAEFVAGLDQSKLPEHVATRVKDIVLDSIASALTHALPFQATSATSSIT